LPIASRTFSKWPPHGRLRSGSVLISTGMILQKVKYRTRCNLGSTKLR
jgi:hypothetical protein